MELSQRCILFTLVCFFLFSISSATSNSNNENFIQCLALHSIPISQIVHTPNNSSFLPIWQFNAHNRKFLVLDTPKPLFIITPLRASHVQATVICSRKHGLQIKTRSGGHDFEGLSFTSVNPSFIVLDLVNMNSIKINIENSSAWVQAASNNGAFFYALAQLSNTTGFPAGTNPSVGFGGLLSGGGIGTLLRKYGLSADNILDAHIVDVNGRILDRKSMGEDLFWAIRGGGGSSFCVILEFKIKLVPVPPVFTTFNIQKTEEQGASELFYKWQYVAHKMSNDVFFRIFISNSPGQFRGNRTILLQFRVSYLGRVEQLLEIMNDAFPELGVRHQDCHEMSYVESVVEFANFPIGTPITNLIQRERFIPDIIVKSKSDFVRKPIPRSGLRGLWNILFEQQAFLLTIDAWGGRMSEISESELPFPHRKGILFDILYFIFWTDNNIENLETRLRWNKKLYEYMAQYVQKSPRSAYVNSIDLDFGRNLFGNKTTYAQAKVWGKRYFGKNFERLALVKGKVDPTNFFRHEQSIPPLLAN